MRIGTIALAICAATIATGALAKTKEVSLRDQEQAACYEDAQKFCGEFIPDEDKVTACMKPLKSKVSAKCAAFYK